MTHTAIKAAIKAEAENRYREAWEHSVRIDDFNEAGKWLLSMLSEWGYVKVPETDEELRGDMLRSMNRCWEGFDSEATFDADAALSLLVPIAQAYAEQKVREALAEEEETRRAVDEAHNEQYVKYKAEIDRLKGLVQTAWTSALNDTGLASFDAFKQKHGL